MAGADRREPDQSRDQMDLKIAIEVAGERLGFFTCCVKKNTSKSLLMMYNVKMCKIGC